MLCLRILPAPSKLHFSRSGKERGKLFRAPWHFSHCSWHPPTPTPKIVNCCFSFFLTWKSSFAPESDLRFPPFSLSCSLLRWGVKGSPGAGVVSRLHWCSRKEACFLTRRTLVALIIACVKHYEKDKQWDRFQQIRDKKWWLWLVLMASWYLSLWCKKMLDMRGKGRIRCYLCRLSLSITRSEGVVFKN